MKNIWRENLSWLKTLSNRRKFLPLLSVLIYWTSLFYLNGLNEKNIYICLIFLFLSYGHQSLELLSNFLLPLILTGIVYDSLRFYSDFLRGPVHVKEPYFFDKNFFGIHTSEGVLTPNEWFQIHNHPIIDFFTGFFYLTFIIMFVLTAAHIMFRVSKKKKFEKSGLLLKKSAIEMMWSFFWVNCLGYSTYFWYAAAPPWYVSIYGLGPARMDTPANVAGTARFDALFGSQFFTNMYGQSLDVFGAIPSLHVSYPLIAVYFAFRVKALRVWSTLFYLMMCFSAVYLNHHYILDIIWGSVYAILCSWLVIQFSEIKNKKNNIIHQVTS